MTEDENLLRIQGQNDIFEIRKVKVFKKYEMFENIVVITDERGEKGLWSYWLVYWYGVMIGQVSGILISTITLENIENRVDENYRIYLERGKDEERKIRWILARIYTETEWIKLADSIPKSEIREKIEEIKNLKIELPIEHMRQAQIQVLEEILKEWEKWYDITSKYNNSRI